MLRPSLNGMRNVKGTPTQSFQGWPVTSSSPPDEKSNTNSSSSSSSKVATSFMSGKQSVAPLPSLPQKMNSLLKRAASSSTVVTSCSCPSLYAGPHPTGADGNGLKSCLKKSSSDACVRRRSTGGDGLKVSFSSVDIREYCRQVGDNPSVSSGCPLAIGWMFNCHGEIDIDSYEADRAIDRAPTRCARLSPKRREEILIEIGGVPHTQIVQGQMQAYYDRSLRTETLVKIGGPCNAKNTSAHERLLIIRESASRKFGRATKGLSPTREQRKLWEEAARQQSARHTI